MSLTTYQLGDQVRVQGVFTTPLLAPIDPDTVTLEVRRPDDTVTTYTGSQLTRVSEGVYTFDVLTDQSGPWVYNWIGSGNLDVATGDTYFTVAQSATVAG